MAIHDEKGRRRAGRSRRPSIGAASRIFAMSILAILSLQHPLRAESGPPDSLLQNHAVRVFLDGSMDRDYIKTRMTYVNYVQDRFDADVHILVTTLSTAIGGTEYTAHFAGQGSFSGMNDTLRYVTNPTDPEEVTRAGLLNTLRMGMMRYVARTPLAAGIVISYRPAARPAATTDPWDYWHFRFGASGDVDGSENASGGLVSGTLSIRRVTPAFKISMYGVTSYTETRMTLPTKELTYVRRYNSLDATVVKSLGEHWSIGGFASALGSSYGRKKTEFSAAPAIEYDVFPYAEITTKEFRFLYTVRISDVRYHEMTIYNKTSEVLASEDLEVSLDVKKNWGTIGGGVEASHYLHDARKNRLRISMSISVELFHGLTLSVLGGYSRIHDEIDTPRGSMTDEDILLGLKRMASSYSYYAGVGFSYHFGSKFTNVVNRRFGTS